MLRLKNQIAVITGGANGIGKATAERFMQEGARVAIWDIDHAEGAAAQLQWKANGWDSKFYQVDTTSLEAVEEATERVVEDFGGINILINNAGVTRDATMKKMTQEQWQQVIDVNLTGVFNCTKVISPILVAAQYGRIINAASIVGLYGNFGQTNYVASKAGVIGMTKVWAREFGPKGITVNAVAPGFIATEMVETIPKELLSKVEGQTPLRRLGTPKDVANAYLFLASEEAAFVTGVTLSIDGGLVF